MPRLDRNTVTGIELSGILQPNAKGFEWEEERSIGVIAVPGSLPRT